LLQALEVISMSRPPLSIIIPTFNAMPRLTECLSALLPGLSAGLVREAVVIDGASSDSSAELATDMGCKVFVLDAKERGRGAQLRSGAKDASGDWLLFLHADTVLSADWVAVVSKHIENNSAQAAYFQLRFDADSSGAKRVAKLANLRARLFGLPYGDQGLLISRKMYDGVGGYQDMPIMEDVDLVRRIGKQKLRTLNCFATTSGDKFRRGGWWAIPCRNLFLLGAYLAGVTPDILAKWYK
jgi:rSAM/selenodomain-associated transferase 2